MKKLALLLALGMRQLLFSQTVYPSYIKVNNVVTPTTFITQTNLTSAVRVSLGYNYAYLKDRVTLYGGNLNVSQNIASSNEYLGKWSTIGAWQMLYNTGMVPMNVPIPVTPGVNYLVNYHRWGNYDAHFGLRERMSDIGVYSQTETGGGPTFNDPNMAIKDAVLSFSYENGVTPSRFIIQTIQGIDAAAMRAGSGNYPVATELATILSNGNFGLGVSNPTATFHVNSQIQNSTAFKIQNSNGTLIQCNNNGNMAFNSVVLTNDVQFYFKGNGSASVFAIDNINGERIISLNNNGSISLPKFANYQNVAANEYWNLKVNSIGQLVAAPDPNGQYNQAAWSTNGNMYQNNNVGPYFGTKSYHNIDLLAGNVTFGVIKGKLVSGTYDNRGECVFSSAFAIGSDYANKSLPVADPYFALTLYNTVPNNSNNSGFYHNSGYLKCVGDNSIVFQVGNEEVRMLNNQFSLTRTGCFIDKHLTLGDYKGIVMDGGSIMPSNNLDPDAEDLGSSDYIWDEIWGANTFTQNLWVGNRVKSDLIPDNDKVYNLGAQTFRWKNLYTMNVSNSASDITLKTNVKNLNYGLNELMKLRPVSYEWKQHYNGTRLGFIAQELKQVIPEVVTVDDSTGLHGVYYSEIIPLLTKSIQEQQKMIDSLKIQMIKCAFSSKMTLMDDSFDQKHLLDYSGFLFQNHPNPFSDITYIDYYAPCKKGMLYFIRITDSNGKLVQSVQVENCGYGQVELDCKNLKSGNYIYSLINGQEVLESKVMNIIKN